ncbi:uncharacterized protein G2W53_003988 [Senna tora]|uniref:Aminotransferase-like plant mobile domain-containing protein n=1 Tax=Senna tora TaxID=362788 RepID=A0A834XB11_9FABA|nr:uncharacterized protein G2W53_003988 [Senna tora]
MDDNKPVVVGHYRSGSYCLIARKIGAAKDPDSSGELFGNEDSNWSSDVSKAKNSRRDRDSDGGSGEKENLGIGFGVSGFYDANGNETRYGSELGYRGDAEFGYRDELEEEEDETRFHRLAQYGCPMSAYCKPRTRGTFIVEPTKETHIRSCVAGMCKYGRHLKRLSRTSTASDYQNPQADWTLSCIPNYDTLSLTMYWFQHLLSGGAQRHTFHMTQGECILTLHDVALLLGLPYVGVPIIGPTSASWSDMCLGLLGHRPPDNKLKGQHLTMTWLDQTFSYANFPPDPTNEQIEQFAQAYILKLTPSSGNNHIMFFVNFHWHGSTHPR